MPVALPGIGVSKDVAIGTARILRRDGIETLQYTLPRHRIEQEVERFRAAHAQARDHLLATRHRIPAGTPDDIAAFIDAHLLMLDDPSLAQAPIELIRHHACNAEWALQMQQNALEEAFDAMDDPYLKTRRDDVQHVIRSITRALLQSDPHADLHTPVEGPQVVLTDDLSPADLLILHHQGVSAVVTERGGPLSHTAILARSLGMPLVMGVKRPYQLIRDDETVVVDGRRGVVLAGLDEPALAFFRGLQSEQQRQRAKLRRLKDLPAITLDGAYVSLQANIELPSDLTAGRQLNMDGVGLFRTEFLFLNRDEPPDEEEQYHVYRSVVLKLKGAPLNIRTLDLGQDKTSSAVPQATAAPLGLRAIRLCLKEPELFRPQLRAILRASAAGPVRMLIPMLTNVAELEQVHRLIAECKRALAKEGHAFDPQLPVGAVIEIPAAALCAESLAPLVDFFSIGTNDLIQYTLATDRIDESVSHLYDPMHPGVLRLIQMVIDAGLKTDTPVAMCGEMAGDPAFTRLLLGMGLRELSMPPAAMLEVKHIIHNSDTSILRHQVQRLLCCQHPIDGLDALERLNAGLF